MTVEREIAGFALPFASGVFASVYAGSDLHGSCSIYAAVALTAATVLSLIILHPVVRHADSRMVRSLIAAAALSAGMFCGFNTEIIFISSITETSASYARKACAAMQAAIDRIPFSDTSCNALAKALITGERSEIPSEMTEAFRESGASHILALSGLHLGIIFMAMTRLLSIAGNGRKRSISRSVIILTACGFYTIATGAGPSIVRAFIFILIHETARLTHRHASTGHTLLTALIIQLALDPSSALSAGFQLSYAAMAGIAFILPWLKSFWPGEINKDKTAERNVRKLWNSLAMSISCQITTGPIAYIYFGTLPKYFLLTNLIAIPLTGIIIPSVIFILILNSLGICPPIAIRTTELLMTFLFNSMEIISTM